MTAAVARSALSSWAQEQHDNGVREDPKGSNDGPPFQLYSLPGELPLSWCARMVRTGMITKGTFAAGPVSITRRDLYDMPKAATMYRILMDKGAVKVDRKDAKPGDIRFLVGRGDSDPLTATEEDGGIHHVGIIAPDGENVIDGNFDDRVMATPIDYQKDLCIFVRYPVDAADSQT